MGAACSKAAVRSEVSPRGVQAPRVGKAPDPVREPQQHDGLEAHAALTLTRGAGTKVPAATAAAAAPSPASAPRAADAQAATVQAAGVLAEVDIKVTRAKQLCWKLSWDVKAQQASTATAAAAAPPAANAARAADAQAAHAQAKTVDVAKDAPTAPPAAEALSAAAQAPPAGKAAPSSQQSAEPVEPVAEDALKAVGSMVPDVKQLGEQMTQDQDAGKVEEMATGALNALSGIMELIGAVTAACGAAKPKAGDKPPSVKDLEVHELTPAQKALIKYSALGKVLLDAAGAAACAFPFGAPVAALLGAIYGKGVQCVKNSQNCNLLLKQLQCCDTQLACVHFFLKKQRSSSSSSTTTTTTTTIITTTTTTSSSSSLTEALQTAVTSLYMVINKAAAAIAEYSKCGCVVRFITSGSNEQLFRQLDEALHKAMGQIGCTLSLKVSMTVLESGSFKDEQAALRAEVCRAANLPLSQAEQALKKLSEEPAKLRELLEMHGSFSDKVVARELQALEGRVTTVEFTLAGHTKTLTHLLEWAKRQEGKGPDGMADFITQWWTKAVGKYQTSLTWPRFKLRLQASLAPDVEKCVRLLAEEAEDNKWTLPADCPPKDVFLDKVLLQLLDTDGDQLITRSELKALQAIGQTPTANEFGAPADMGELLELVHVCHDRNRLQVDLTCASKRDAAAAKLQAGDIIKSYNTARLLDDYLPGTRTWLFDEITAWRAAASQQQDSSSRMFLLLADAGMGKSVCSAVLLKHLAAANAQVAAAKARSQPVVAHHFFKVGQQRGEGKAMIRCLAQQLCGSLPGLADLVEQQIRDIPDLASLSMVELFDKVLLTPLKQLDQDPDKQQKPECLLVLDALDESTDNNQGWQPVCNLVAAQFQHLPSWVCVLVTGRPQVESRFDTWKPAKWIATTDEHNQSDLHRVLLAKLKHSKLVDDSVVEEAANLLLKKSQGQFIYAKYVFNRLEQQAHWNLEQLAELPDGLQQVYCYQLDTILAALQAERPKLVALFKERLLPMLAVMKEALPTHVLAWLVKGNQEGVQQEHVALLLRLLYSLFPSRPGPDGTLEVAPYHKSIQDFLLCDSDQRAASAAELKWKTPAAEAHRLFVARLLPELQKPQLAHWRDACGPQVLPDLPAAQQYCLQYTVDHIALAKDWAALHQLLRHLPGLKAVLEVPGQVYKLIRVLADSADNCQTEERQVFVGVQRFLRTASNLITQDPHSILQEMAYSPHDCVLGDWCEQHFNVQQAIADALQHQASTAFWKGALLSPVRAATFPAEVALLQGHTEGVMCCAISPDGRTVVSGSVDKSLKVWDLSTGQLRTTLEGHEDWLKCCAITPDGLLLVSGSYDATLKVWDLTTGQLRTTLRGHTERVQCCAISPDGKTLVSGSRDNTLRVWDLPGGQLRTTLEQEGCVSFCAITPDGQTLLSGPSNGKVVVWNLLTGQLRTTLEGHEDWVTCCALSPDGQLLVSGPHDDTRQVPQHPVLKVWNLSTGAYRTSLEPVTTPTSCIISPDMSMVMATGGKAGCVYVWDLPSGKLHTKLEGAGWVSCCAISPDGQLLVSGSIRTATMESGYEGYNALTVWDLRASLKEHADEQEPANKQEPADPLERERLPCCAVNSHTLVLGSQNRLQVWDLPSGQLRKSEEQVWRVWCCSISPDGQMLVCGIQGAVFKVYDLPSGQLRITLEASGDVMRGAIISPDCKTLVIGWELQESECSPQKGELHVWDLPTGQLRTKLSHEGGDLSCCAISADGRLLVCGSTTSIKVWDLASGQETATLVDGAGARCCAISSDSQLLVCGFDGPIGFESRFIIKVWDLPTGDLLLALQGHYACITWCNISPDGKTLVACSSTRQDLWAISQAVQVWDLHTGEEHSKVEQEAHDCALSSDGQLLALLSSGDMRRVWDLKGKEISKVVQEADSCALSCDGRMMAFASNLGKLKAWVLMGNWQQGPAPPPYNETMSFHRWCPGAPGYYLL